MAKYYQKEEIVEMYEKSLLIGKPSPELFKFFEDISNSIGYSYLPYRKPCQQFGLHELCKYWDLLNREALKITNGDLYPYYTQICKNAIYLRYKQTERRKLRIREVINNN